jgi:hypothetical protein
MMMIEDGCRVYDERLLLAVALDTNSFCGGRFCEDREFLRDFCLNKKKCEPTTDRIRLGIFENNITLK